MDISTFVGALKSASSVRDFLLDEQVVSILSAIGDTHLEAATRDLKSAKSARNSDTFIEGARTNLRTSQVAYENLLKNRGDLSSHFQLFSTSTLYYKLIFTINLQIMCAVHLRERNEADSLLRDLKKPIDNLHILYHGPDVDTDTLGGFLKFAANAVVKGPLAFAGFLNPGEWKKFIADMDFEFEVERYPRDIYEEFKRAVRNQF